MTQARDLASFASGDFPDAQILGYYTNDSHRNTGSHANNINVSFNVDHIDKDFTPPANANIAFIRIGAEVIFYQGWSGGGWGGTSTTSRLKIDNTDVITPGFDSTGLAHHYIGVRNTRNFSYIHDCSNGNQFNLKYRIESNSTTVGSTWYIGWLHWELMFMPSLSNAILRT